MKRFDLQKEIRKLSLSTKMQDEFHEVLEEIEDFMSKHYPEHKNISPKNIFAEVASDKKNHKAMVFTQLDQYREPFLFCVHDNEEIKLSANLVKKIRILSGTLEDECLANYQSIIRQHPSKPLTHGYSLNCDAAEIGKRVHVVSREGYTNKPIQREGYIVAVTEKEFRFSGEDSFSRGVYVVFDDNERRGGIAAFVSRNSLKYLSDTQNKHSPLK